MILKIGIISFSILMFVLVYRVVKTRQMQRKFQVCLSEVLMKASSELELDQTSTVTLENSFKARVCLTCPGYVAEEYIYSQTKKFGISKRVAGRVAKKIPRYDGDYLVLINEGKVVCVVHFQGCACPEIRFSDTNIIGKPILFAEIGNQIKITLKKIAKDVPLLIVKIE